MSTEQSYFSPEEMEAFMAERRRVAEAKRAELARRGHPDALPRDDAGRAASEASDGVPDLATAGKATGRPASAS